MSGGLLPPNASRLERAVDAAIGRRFDGIEVPIKHLLNPATCPAPLLPWLAWSLHMTDLEGWTLADTEQKKRALLAAAVPLHRKKGTPQSILNALDRLGYPDCSIVEHKQLKAQWLAAGGRVLDGTRVLEGARTLSSSTGRFRFMTGHWAEYAIRVNMADDSLSTARQREIIDIAKHYAPARCRLRALVMAVILHFHNEIKIVRSKVRGRIVFDGCSRFDVQGRRVLDGCGTLGGGYEPSLLDGRHGLTGARKVGSPRPIGRRLSDGHWGLRIAARANYPMLAAGGDRTEPPRKLGEPRRLDGTHKLGGRTFTGLRRLNGHGRLSPRLLGSPYRCLDGTRHLGTQPGLPGIWSAGYITVRRGSHTYREPL